MIKLINGMTQLGTLAKTIKLMTFYIILVI